MGKDTPRLRPPRRRNQRLDLERDDVLEFLRAVDRYKADHGVRFLRWSEVFAVFVGLGYRKVKAPAETTP